MMHQMCSFFATFNDVCCRVLLERLWRVVAQVAEAIGADVYDWDSTLPSHSSRMSCMSFDGVHPSLEVYSETHTHTHTYTHTQTQTQTQTH